jgi:hypothetical protein
MIKIERETASRCRRECRFVAGFRVAVEQPAGMVAVDIRERLASDDEGEFLLREAGEDGAIFSEICDGPALDSEILLVAVATIFDHA